MKVKKKPETFTLQVPEISREIQAKIKMAAVLAGINLRDWIKQAIQEKADEQIKKGGTFTRYKDSRNTLKKKARLAISRWYSMIDRCENPDHPKYKDYGERGIKVCKRWHKFENFYEDTGDPPMDDGDPPKNKSLDRWPNNDGNYKPDNWRWATAKEQYENSRSSRPRQV